VKPEAGVTLLTSSPERP